MAPMSDGRKQLLKALQVVSTGEVAERCRVKQPAVSQWANGQTTPSARSQSFLRERVWTVVGPW